MSQINNMPRPAITDARGTLDRTAKLSMRTRTYAARTIAECLQKAKQELGIEAMIVSKRTYRQGALFGRWGGHEMVEVTFGTYRPAPVTPNLSTGMVFSNGQSRPTPLQDAGESASTIQKLEEQIAGLSESVQNLMDKKPAIKPKSPGSEFIKSPVEALFLGVQPETYESSASVTPEKPARRTRGKSGSVQQSPASDNGPYPSLMQQLVDAEVAAPLARQLLADVPDGLSVPEAAASLRTVLAQRLRIANRVRIEPGHGMQLVAFIGTTGVGKTTTIAKLTAQYSIMERRRVGVITLDTHRIAAAQQLQTYGQILKVPVLVAHNKVELHHHLAEFRGQGMELVLIDTAGRSPNDMMPLGDTADMFEGQGPVHKFLALPATLAARDMENIAARFQSILNPDALVLTKLDEATDNACFGKLLTVQAKTGLPLAYVTTGQKVPDDITFPDAHAIAARILSTAIL